jgi:lipid II:glycine glycyltransferase (peptidoglycan interpeptide bridge formation enzyme)
MRASNHPLQSLQWAEFRKKTGVKVIKSDNFQITIHQLPFVSWTIGYIPKGPLPDKKMVSELIKIGKKEKCIFIQLEPNIIKNNESRITNNEYQKFQSLLQASSFKLQASSHPLFTKYTFILDLTKSEDELLKNMHSKTRYNIKVAQKHGVKVLEDNSDEAFETYLRLTRETTKRQSFYAHTQQYHRLMWQTLRCHPELACPPNWRVSGSNSNSQGMPKQVRHDNFNELTAHLLLAELPAQSSQLRASTLVAWILFVYKDTLYYPYGGSSTEHRETMASNLMMWETIKFGKNLGLKRFDMWGALGPDPNPKDPWYGFHKFKKGYGPQLVEFIGSYDLIISPILYEFYKIADRLRWLILSFGRHF